MPHIGELIDVAKGVGHVPRLHPNGFVQLDLGPGQRLHIWTPDVDFPKPAVPVQIHDHTFSFTSHILAGTLLNTHHTEHIDDIGAHRIFQVPPYLAVNKDAPFELNDTSRYAMEADDLAAIRSGGDYAFPAFHFHDTRFEGFTATVIQVSDFDRTLLARVAVPFPEDPDFSFRRDCVPQEQLWEVIDKLRALPILE